MVFVLLSTAAAFEELLIGMEALMVPSVPLITATAPPPEATVWAT